jgi:hypothetical protein
VGLEPTARSDWEQFCERAAALMRDALEKREGLGPALHRKKAFSQVVDFFNDSKVIADPQLRDAIFNLLMEVGGTGPEYYAQLLALFAARASEEELRRYFEI